MRVPRNGENTASSWLLGSFVLAACSLLSSDNGCHPTGWGFVDARPMTSFQLATGKWDVSIRGAYWMDPSILFPSVDTDSSRVGETSNSNDDHKIRKSVPIGKRKGWGKSLDCTLSLASDGTFVLTPKRVTTTETHDPDNTAGVTPTTHERFANLFRKQRTQTRKQERGVLDLRGSWKVLANPYCVTDRFYDQVSFTAYPRQRVLPAAATAAATISEGNGAAAGNVGTKYNVLQTVQWTMHCRVWGRHTRTDHRQGPGRKGTNPYRMTHGTLVVRDVCREGEHFPWWKTFYRPVVASFSAVRSSDKPNHEGWVDENRYGY
eukprot:jgi/Psemu1/325298/estExt_fgenesh1_pg.C_2230002